MKRTCVWIALGVLLPLVAQAQSAQGWVEESNRNAQVLLEVLARFNPEGGAQLGVDGYDDKVIDLEPRVYERTRDATQQALAELRARKAKTTDPAVLQDLDILIQSAEENLESGRLQYEMTLPYIGAAGIAFNGIQGLLDERIPKERRAAAALRLRRYAGLEPGSTPLIELAKARTVERIGVAGLVGPYKGQIEQDLSDTPRLMQGIRDLFKQHGQVGNDAVLDALDRQLKDYDAWLKAELMPRARADHRLPPALYADNLKQFGVDVPPEELIRRALLSFGEIRNEMQALAPIVARQKGFKAHDYRDVIRELKKKQFTGKAILPVYRERLAAIEKLIRREQVVTVPARKAVIRLGTEAESAVTPAPFMNPPRLIGNTGEYGEFVLPLKVPGKDGKDLKTDDFTHDAAAWTLTVHEARPGHEMQFAAMVEKGVSIARGVFAFNSTNVEGWALYAEAEMKPFFPADGQLIGLQHRLMRAARAFLDPMVNLGQIQPEEVKAFLMREVVLSEGMAQQEMDRYTYRAPGQATSYFVGYQALMHVRQRAELALREKFDKQRFHDFVLAQGLLPPKLLEKAVMEDFVAAEKAR